MESKEKQNAGVACASTGSVSSVYQTSLGKVVIAVDGEAVTKISFGEFAVAIDYRQSSLADMAMAQLEEYFAGKRTEFTVPLRPEGTEFQQQVWAALQEIPYGQTRSYRQIAERIGRPKACRAVGLANSKNPIWIMIPCHRVVGADGSLTGYAGGLPLKQRLLDIEKIAQNEG